MPTQREEHKHRKRRANGKFEKDGQEEREEKKKVTTLPMHFLCVKLKVKVLAAQPCPTLCDPIDCSPPGSSIHGILQARILEWVVVTFSRGSSQPRDQTWVSCIAARFFTI